MKNYYFLLLLYFFNTAVQAQQVDQSVIASAGSIDKAAGISLEWTLGEPMVETVSTKDKLITQGFHQPVLLARKFFVAADNRNSDYKIRIAPNPVQSVLKISYSVPEAKEVMLVLSDFTGRQLNVQRAENDKGILSIDMSGMIAGVYLLNVQSREGSIIQSFKIIKGH